MKFCFFRLMPYTDVANAPTKWPVANAAFDSHKANALYRRYVDTTGASAAESKQVGGSLGILRHVQMAGTAWRER